MVVNSMLEMKAILVMKIARHEFYDDDDDDEYFTK